jgi:hypothetical protein
MKVVSVATLDSRAYYSILSRLKRTNLRFMSLTPQQANLERTDPVITTKSELGFFAGAPIPIEELDENPMIMEGQIISWMVSEAKRTMLIGVDPGARIGVVVFYGGSELGSFTVDSVDLLRSRLLGLVRGIPNAKVMVKVGDGAPRQSRSISQMIIGELPQALVEVVDERGTTASNRSARRSTKDESAAAKIARRRGTPFIRPS